ncbi:hypothetical protein [Streptomyces sp. NPDC003299]
MRQRPRARRCAQQRIPRRGQGLPEYDRGACPDYLLRYVGTAYPQRTAKLPR